MQRIYLTENEKDTLYFFLRNINEEYLTKVLSENFEEEQVKEIYGVLDNIYNQIGEND